MDEIRILTIDGGGARGIYPAHILKRIKEELGINYSEYFDIIAGTSTGSIIAAALALEIPIDKICEMYEDLPDQIFKRKSFNIRGLFRSRYSNKNLVKILDKTFQNYKMKETKTNLIIPSTDLANSSVYVHKTPYKPEFVRDGDTLVKDAVLSSCSAPTYFDSVKMKNGKKEEYLLSDGGVWANNPSMIAFIEAINPNRLNFKMNEVKILSLGTGISKRGYKFSKRNWGLISWGTKLVDMILGIQSQVPHNMLSLILPEENYLRIDFCKNEKLPLDKYSEEIKSKASEDFTYKFDEIKKFFK